MDEPQVLNPQVKRLQAVQQMMAETTARLQETVQRLQTRPTSFEIVRNRGQINRLEPSK